MNGQRTVATPAVCRADRCPRRRAAPRTAGPTPRRRTGWPSRRGVCSSISSGAGHPRDRVAEPVQRADARVAAPREDQLAGAARADDLVVDEVRGHPGERQVAPALADDLVPGGERDEMGEPLERDRVAVVHELGHGIGQRHDLGHTRNASGRPVTGQSRPATFRRFTRDTPKEMRGSGVGVPFGGPRDVADHAAEDEPVERRDGPPVQVPGQPAGQEDGALAVARSPRPRPARTVSSSQAGPGTFISARSRSSARRPCRQPRPARSRGRRRRGGGRGSRRPRRSPTPPTSRSSQPRTDQASGNEYQPVPPPMPSMTRHSASGSAVHGRSRSSTYTAAAGPLRVARQRVAAAAPGRAASDQRVSTSPSLILAQGERDGPVVAGAAPRAGRARTRRCRARGRPPRAPASRPAGRRWRAAPGSRGSTQCDESRGVSTGTGSDRAGRAARRRPRSAASSPR